MAETPLAIRTGDDVKALFNELAESGNFENKGEFLNRLLVMYQSEASKKFSPILKPAIDIIETLTTRLLDVLNGTAASIETHEEEHIQVLNDQKAASQKRITELERECNAYSETIVTLTSDIENIESNAKELAKRIEQLENAINDKTELIAEYKEKNDVLTGIVTGYKVAADENARLIEAVSSLEKENARLKFENENSILELKQYQQSKLEEQHAKHAAAISDYESKVMELLKFQSKPALATE